MVEDYSLISKSRICAVCDRESSLGTAFRMHYNVFSCEACKCFFRRSIQLKKTFACKYFNECYVSNKISRQFCKACRLRKCFQVGMMRESVKAKKYQNSMDQPISVLENSNSDVTSSSIADQLSYVNNESDISCSDAHFRTFPQSNNDILNKVELGINTDLQVNLLHNCSLDDFNSKSKEVTNLPPHFHCDSQFSNVKDFTGSNSHGQSGANSSNICKLLFKSSISPAQSFLDSIVEGICIPKEKYEVASIEEVLDSLKIRILDLFKWAKRSLEFGKLKPNDQKSLLRYTVVELVMLGFARASIHYDEVLYFNHINKIIQPNHPNSAVACVTKLTIEKLVKPLRFLNLNRSEYRIMKEIILYNPSSTSLEDFALVREMRRSRFRHLYIEASHDISRFGDILSLLTPLFEVATEITEQLRLEQYVQESEATMDAFLLISLLQEGQVDD